MKHSTEGPLNVRQTTILDLVSQGHDHAEIARILGLSRVAVSDNVRAAVAKMGVPNSHQAVARFVQARTLAMVAARLDTWVPPVEQRHRSAEHDLCAAYAATFRNKALELMP